MSSSNEIELCYMVEVRRPEGYAEASAVEIHEQYEYKLPPAEGGVRRGKIRIRKTTANNETTYTETIKTPNDPSSMLGDMESNTEINEAFFKAWRHVYRADGQHKIRHTFVATNAVMNYQGTEIKLPPVHFELDVFIDKTGSKSKWAKVDIEVQDIIKMLKESYEEVDVAKFEIKFDCLPLDIGQVVSMVTKHSEERAAIDNFFKRYCIPYEVDDGGKNNDQSTGSSGN